MLKTKGLTDGHLYTRIRQAVKDSLITEDMGEWAHQVRLGANDSRHADLSHPHHYYSDAKRAVDFAEALGQFMFVLPALVKRGIAAAQEVPPQTEALEGS